MLFFEMNSRFKDFFYFTSQQNANRTLYQGVDTASQIELKNENERKLFEKDSCYN